MIWLIPLFYLAFDFSCLDYQRSGLLIRYISQISPFIALLNNQLAIFTYNLYIYFKTPKLLAQALYLPYSISQTTQELSAIALARSCRGKQRETYLRVLLKHD